MKRRQQKRLSQRLFEAVLAGDATTVKTLLRSGASPQGRDNEGTTPLYLASVQGEAEVARLLLEAGACPDEESRGPGSEGTPLCAAACWGHTATVRELLAHGADPNLREDQGTGWSPLDWAQHGRHTDSAEVLVAAGAQPRTDGVIDLDAAAAALLERAVEWRSAGLAVGTMTWRDQQAAWPQPLETDRARVKDPESLGLVISGPADATLSVVLFRGGWADVHFFDGRDGRDGRDDAGALPASDIASVADFTAGLDGWMERAFGEPGGVR
ncbi:Ankyrin repeat-containing protein [Streptomyces sp. DI166]|nr:Ankyrin repeat-containing protein [Streptomyces sp. DI166]